MTIRQKTTAKSLALLTAILSVAVATTASAGPVPLTNVAPRGVATQSTTGFGGEAARANDGNTVGIYNSGSTTHTATGDAAPSWEVDLQMPYDVVDIVLWNRTDCCSHRLTNFRLSVTGGSQDYSADFFTDGTSFPDPSVEIELPPGTNGQVVRIDRLGPDTDGALWLSLAEVQIFAPVEEPPVVVSQPVGGGTHAGCFFALNAVVEGADSMRWTKDGVDVAGATEASLVFDPLAFGDSGDYQLHAENAFGSVSSDVVTIAVDSRINWAGVGTATQSTTGFGGGPERANDCNTDGVYPNASVTHTDTGDTDPWWEVDLGQDRPIDLIAVWNRTDCCGDRLHDFRVLILSESREVLFSADVAEPPAPSVEVPVGKVVGRIVRVEFVDPASHDPAQLFLSLAEVEVLSDGAPPVPGMTVWGFVLTALGGVVLASFLLRRPQPVGANG